MTPAHGLSEEDRRRLDEWDAMSLGDRYRTASVYATTFRQLLRESLEREEALASRPAPSPEPEGAPIPRATMETARTATTRMVGTLETALATAYLMGHERAVLERLSRTPIPPAVSDEEQRAREAVVEAAMEWWRWNCGDRSVL